MRNPFNTPKMTGRTRYRLQESWFSATVLVLQVEWKEWTYSMGVNMREYLYWTDARLEDLSVEEAQQGS